MRVQICSSLDKDAAFYIQFAERQGQPVVVEVDRRGITQYFVEVLTDGPVYRAPDAVFERITSQFVTFDRPLRERREA